MKRETACWFGRFQPPTIAHLCTLTVVLKKWRRAVVGVVRNVSETQYRVGPRWETYYHLMERASYSPERNPFTSHEVVAMWSAAIIAAGFDRRVHVKSVPRPERWEGFNTAFPPNCFDFIEAEGGSGNVAIEAFRKSAAPALYNRPIYWVKPSFILHNIEIQKRVLEGSGSWEEYIPPGAYELFIQLKGPTRIIEAYEKIDAI